MGGTTRQHLDVFAGFVWYSLSASRQICLYGLEHNPKFHGLRPTWPFLIINVLAIWAKCLGPPAYFRVINCAFTTHRTNVFDCFRGIMAQFKVAKCPVGWDCRIHQLHLCRGVRPLPNECPAFDSKQLICEMLSTPLMPLNPRSTLTRGGSTW